MKCSCKDKLRAYILVANSPHIDVMMLSCGGDDTTDAGARELESIKRCDI